MKEQASAQQRARKCFGRSDGGGGGGICLAMSAATCALTCGLTPPKPQTLRRGHRDHGARVRHTPRHWRRQMSHIGAGAPPRVSDSFWHHQTRRLRRKSVLSQWPCQVGERVGVMFRVLMLRCNHLQHHRLLLPQTLQMLGEDGGVRVVGAVSACTSIDTRFRGTPAHAMELAGSTRCHNTHGCMWSESSLHPASTRVLMNPDGSIDSHRHRG